MKKVSHDGGFRILLKKNLRDFDGQVIRKLGGKVNVLSESVRVFKVSETIRSITECYYATRLTVGCIPNRRSWYQTCRRRIVLSDRQNIQCSDKRIVLETSTRLRSVTRTKTIRTKKARTMA